VNIAANLRFEIIVTGNCIPIDIGIAQPATMSAILRLTLAFTHRIVQYRNYDRILYLQINHTLLPIN